MSAYHVDWVGALTAGAVSVIVFLVLRTAFPRLAGARFYLALGLLIAACSLVFRELLRYVGI